MHYLCEWWWKQDSSCVSVIHGFLPQSCTMRYCSGSLRWSASIIQARLARVSATCETDCVRRNLLYHDDVIKWKHFPRYWPFVRGNSPETGEFPTQRPVTRSFDGFVDLRLNKRLSKQWWGWWFETLSRPLWRHPNVIRYLLCSDAVCNVTHGLARNFSLGASLWLHRRKSTNIIGAYFAK